MFDSTRAYSSFAARDLDAAREFYSGILGLEVVIRERHIELMLESGARIMVYEKENHTPASFTVLNFEVDDADAAVSALNARGVTTKIYDDSVFPTDDKGIARGHGQAIAWFLDPSDNVIAVNQVD